MFGDVYVFKKCIRLFQSLYIYKFHFCYEAILECGIDSFYSSFCLWSKSENKINPKSITYPSKLCRGIGAFWMIVFVRGKSIEIDTLRHSMRDSVISPKWKDIFNAFILTEYRINYLARGIIDSNEKTPFLSF